MSSAHGDTRRETKFLKVYANHTMLTPPQGAMHLVIFKISIYLCRSRSEKLNRMPQRSKTQLQRSKTQLHFSTVEYPTATLNSGVSTDVFSKSSKSSDHLFWAWRHPHSSPISCLEVYYDKWWLSYPLCTSVKLHQMTQILTKLNDKTWLTKNDQYKKIIP